MHIWSSFRLQICSTFGRLFGVQNPQNLSHPSPHQQRFPEANRCELKFSPASNQPHVSQIHAPNVLHIWSPKLFQMCTQNGTKSSKTCTNTTTASTFGTFLASKCAAHLEPFSAYRILRKGYALYHAIDGSRKQIARKPNFYTCSSNPRMSQIHAPNV